MSVDTDYFSVSEAAAFLGVGNQAVYRAIDRGALKSEKMHGLTVIKKSAVHAYKETHAYKKRKETEDPHPNPATGADSDHHDSEADAGTGHAAGRNAGTEDSNRDESD